MTNPTAAYAWKHQRDLNSKAMHLKPTERTGMHIEQITAAADIDMVIAMKAHGMTINTTRGAIDISPGWIADYLANQVRVAMVMVLEEAAGLGATA